MKWVSFLFSFLLAIVLIPMFVHVLHTTHIHVHVCLLQVLTLASNERVPLTPSMRLLFEIGHLRAATPATVSRAGILFVNPADLGWNP